MARDATDVLVALDLEPGSRRSAVERRAPPAQADGALLEAMGWQPATLDQLVAAHRTVASPRWPAALTRLELDGWVAQRGGWYERVAKPGA